MPDPLQEINHPTDSLWKTGFELDFPQFVKVNSASGKGKSTFINLIYGTRHDYTGDIQLNGENIRNLSLNEWILLRQTKLSVVFQDLQLFPELSAWENLILKNNLTQYKTESEIKTMLNQLGLTGKEGQRCGTLSMGQQQRLAIIRSLLQPFEILLLDEPFSHLDLENSEIALELIVRETKKQGAGFLLTSLGSDHGYRYDAVLNL
jgi:putative ABC transport system ATP-binding protein